MPVGTVTIALRAARGAADQQREIDAWLARTGSAARDPKRDARQVASDGRELAIVAEGAFFELVAPAGVALTRLAAGCVCCTGWIPLRVHLQRAVRAGARSILLLVASDEHLPRVREMLGQSQLGFDARIDEAHG
jgi:hypothetical protein